MPPPSVLQVQGMTINVPKATTSAIPEELFRELATKFKSMDPVLKHLLETLKLETLEEFALVFSTEEAVATEFQRIKNVPGVQVARAKMAWQGVRMALQEADVIKRKTHETSDLEILMDKGDLDNLQAFFWNRHRLMWPVRIEPGDAVISRFHKEIIRRALQVKDVWTVRSSRHHLR